jgi:hypothetical protein
MYVYVWLAGWRGCGNKNVLKNADIIYKVLKTLCRDDKFY